MKLLFSILLLTVFLFQTQISYSDDFSIDVFYQTSEKSKDSHSTTEKITVTGSAVSYSVKYTGMRSSKMQNKEISCTFTDQNIENIKATILKKNLNVTDSLTRESEKEKDYQSFCTIRLTINMDGKIYNIYLKGETSEFSKEDLYKNSIFLISMLDGLVKNCE